MENRNNHVVTYTGTKVSFENMTHQHACNWYWYSKLVMEDEKRRKFFKDLINRRFDGVMLMYKPHLQYEYEINMLKTKGYMNEYNQIFVGNTQIGEAVYG